jgi:proteasome lid subunit RPN8/RPN11
LISRGVLSSIVQQARAGYEKPYKREILGFLFGRIKARNVEILRVKKYTEGTRSGVPYDVKKAHKIAKAHAKCFKLKFLGKYHTHLEIRGKKSWGLSSVDRKAIRDENSITEILVGVYSSADWRRLPVIGYTQKRILIYDEKRGYRYTVSAYTKQDGGARLTPIWLKWSE